MQTAERITIGQDSGFESPEERFQFVQFSVISSSHKLSLSLFKLLVVAEGEIQKQQKYYVGFISGLCRDFR